MEGSHNNAVKKVSLSGTISEDNKPPYTCEGGGQGWCSSLEKLHQGNSKLPQTLGDSRDVQPWRLTPRVLIHLPSLLHMPCKCVS